MRWQRFFEDLEQQLDSEWEAERAALDSEAERLRLSRLMLARRLAALAAGAAVVRLELAGDTAMRGTMSGAGSDWVVLDPEPVGAAVLVPLTAILAVGADERDVLRSARPDEVRAPLAERMTFGFVLRDLVRRRAVVRVRTTDGRDRMGTIDRAGADHLDLALHDPGSPRRREAVTGSRIIPFTAVSCVHLDAPG